jgi:hypothetical protein
MNFNDPKLLLLLKAKALAQAVAPRSLFLSSAQNILDLGKDKVKVSKDRQYGYFKGDKLPSPKADHTDNLKDLTLTEEFNTNAKL